TILARIHHAVPCIPSAVVARICHSTVTVLVLSGCRRPRPHPSRHGRCPRPSHRPHPHPSRPAVPVLIHPLVLARARPTTLVHVCSGHRPRRRLLRPSHFFSRGCRPSHAFVALVLRGCRHRVHCSCRRLPRPGLAPAASVHLAGTLPRYHRLTGKKKAERDGWEQARE
ncbi:Os03g0401951, partial [Oryza sativa Japonica Group]